MSCPAVIKVITPGPPGAPGEPGPSGIGAEWQQGAGVPGSGVGSDGDFYLNTSNGDIYGPKTGGAWGSVIFNIAEGQQGPPGDQGEQGPIGKSLLGGLGAPGSGVGTDGDFYIDVSAPRLYGPKAAGAWGAGVSLVGPQGVKGDDGDQGPPGPVVKSDWNATTGDAEILNKPALGSAAFQDSSAFATAAQGTDARTPTAHAASHGSGGADAITVAQSQVTGLSAALAGKETAGTAAAAVAAHEAAADPHPGYLTPAEANAAYATTAQGAKADTAVQPAALSSYLTTAAAASGYQPLDSDLTAIAALSTTSYGRAFLALADAAAARTAMGLGTAATTDATAYATAAQGSKADTAVQPAALAGYQPIDTDLTAIAALTTTSFGRALLELADAAAARTALGLATVATSGAYGDLSGRPTIPTPGGSDTQIQFNDGGSFGGDVDLTYNKTTNLLTTKGDVRLDDGGSFTTTLQTITATANRTISFPDATGTVALVGGSSGQLLYNLNGTVAGTSVTFDATTGTRFVLPFGYGAGAGGTQTQGTNKSTTVVLNTRCGQITMNAANLAANTAVSFTLTNSQVAATDLIVINHVSGGTTGAYLFGARAAAGSATITVRNVTAGDLAEAIVIAFAVIKASTT